MERRVTFVTPPSACEYLPDRAWQLRYEVVPRLRPGDYAERLRHGWRRFGRAIFRPECPACRMCQSLRVPVDTFVPTASQRRAWRKNQGAVTLRIGAPRSSPDKLRLFARFHQWGFETKGWPPWAGDDLEVFIDNPFPTEEWCYYVGDRLIGVGYVDSVPESLSAIYFFYDPAERHRSPGTFNVLSIIEAARQRRLPHVYLGYYVEGCRSLEYKQRFRPNEVIREDGRWVPFGA